MHPEIVSRVKILSGMDVAEKRRPQDGRIGTLIRENAIDVRVSSYPTIYGEKIVMRLLDKNALRPSPEHLGMISRDLRLLYDKLDAPFGLVMISGPTGSGKTTTLYSCLSYIDKKTKNVLTVEDPVEYRLKGVHQMQVNEKIGLTFASGLRTILRQDPDVIMVGECRDGETAGMAIQAALTGHIVFSTIHTNDAVGVIPRLIDMGVEPFLVANSVSLCIAQRLVRRICRHCQAPEEGQSVLERLHNDAISDERLAALGIVVDPDLTYVTGRGCVHCRNTGYQGRQAVFEIFEIDQDARAEIVSPTFDANVMRRRARERGMTTLIGHGMMLIDEGMTTHSEVVRVDVLDNLAAETPQKKLRAAIEEVSEEVQHGVDLADAMARHPRMFDSVYVNVVKAGMESARLAGSLTEIAHYLKVIHDTERKVRSGYYLSCHRHDCIFWYF